MGIFLIVICVLLDGTMSVKICGNIKPVITLWSTRWCHIIIMTKQNSSDDLFIVPFHQTVEPVDQLLQCVDPAKDRELWVKDNKTGEIRPVDMEIWAQHCRRIMSKHWLHSGICTAWSSCDSWQSEGQSVSQIPLRSKVTVSGEITWAMNDDVTEQKVSVCAAWCHAEVAGITKDQEASGEHFTPVNVEKLYVVPWRNAAILLLLYEVSLWEHMTQQMLLSKMHSYLRVFYFCASETHYQTTTMLTQVVPPEFCTLCLCSPFSHPLATVVSFFLNVLSASEKKTAMITYYIRHSSLLGKINHLTISDFY